MRSFGSLLPRLWSILQHYWGYSDTRCSEKMQPRASIEQTIIVIITHSFPQATFFNFDRQVSMSSTRM
jgi:hypothetical protein